MSTPLDPLAVRDDLAEGDRATKSRQRAQESVIRSGVYFAALLTSLSAMLVGIDAVAYRYSPAAGLVDPNFPSAARLALFGGLLPAGMVVMLLFERSTLFALVFLLTGAGAASNLICFPLFDGAPDYLMFVDHLPVLARIDVSSLTLFFNAGDVALALGLLLVPVAGACAVRRQLGHPQPRRPATASADRRRHSPLRSPNGSRPVGLAM